MENNNNIKTEGDYRIKDAKLAILFTEWIMADDEGIKSKIAKKYMDRLEQLRKKDLEK